MATALTRTSTSPGPGTGSGRSVYSRRRGPVWTSAFTVQRPRVHVDLGCVAPDRLAAARQDPGDLVQRDRRRDERERVHGARCVQVGDSLQPAGGAEHADRRHVLERHRAGVDQAGLAGEADVDHAAPGFDEVQGQGRQTRRVGGVHHGVPAPGRHGLPRPRVPEPEPQREGPRPLAPSDQVDLDAHRCRDPRHQQPDGSGAQHQQSLAGLEPGSPYGAQRIASGLDHRARRRPNRLGQGHQRPDGHRQLLGQGARPAMADADLVAIRTQVLASTRAAPAGPAAQHRVAGHAPPTHVRVHPLPDRRDRAGPLVADPDGIRGLVRVQVGHLARVELDIRAADARPLDVDDHLADPGLRPRQLVHLGGSWARDHERPHRHRHAVSRMPTMMPCATPAGMAVAGPAWRAAAQPVPPGRSALWSLACTAAVGAWR